MGEEMCIRDSHKILERRLTSQVLRTIVHILKENVDDLVSDMLEMCIRDRSTPCTSGLGCKRSDNLSRSGAACPQHRDCGR